MNTQDVVVARPSGWLHGRLGTVVLWALLICTESAGQLFTKVAGNQLGQMDFNWQWLSEVARNPGILAAIESRTAGTSSSVGASATTWCPAPFI